MAEEYIVLGGGCFWCIEAVFKELEGVKDVISGYAGGTTSNPTYEDVCSGLTGHAEVIKVIFYSEVISLRELIEIFFTIHDPTQLNRQGADIGSQYRSIILFTSEEQKEIAEKVIKEIEKKEIWEKPIVTEVKKLDTFYEAETYHQDYYANNSNQPYCRIVISPKINKVKKAFVDKLKTN